jgi:crossover junction endodeoxyribonuclease RusA
VSPVLVDGEVVEPLTTFAARTPAPSLQTDVVVEFFVPGKPAPQGSKRHVGRGIMVESSREVGPWRERVALAAHQAMHIVEVDGRLPVIAGAVTLALTFVLPRPKATPKRRTPAATKRPDVDKLARSVLDAITDVIIVDDAQVTDLRATKRLAEVGESPGVKIRIAPRRIGGDRDAA